MSGLALLVIVVAPLALAMALAWWDHRQEALIARFTAVAHGHCPVCAYPLVGMHGDRCPECGADLRRFSTLDS